MRGSLKRDRHASHIAPAAWPSDQQRQSDIMIRQFEFLTLSKLHARFARELLKLARSVGNELYACVM